MKWVKKCPLLVLLLSTGLLFTIIGFVGKRTIYAEQDHQPLQAPVMSVMFTGLHDGIYPWQIFTGQPEEAMAQAQAEPPIESGIENPVEAETVKEVPPEPVQTVSEPEETEPEKKIPEEEPNEEEPEQTSGADDIPPERIEPLRESTREEYLNHISADIYGDAGVQRAAEYSFTTVDESYFDDALFIGDSRTVGLRDYTDLSEHADFYCETSLTIYKLLDENFKGKGTIAAALKKKNYGKIYLMVGINELGRGTTEDFMAKYTEVVDTLHEWAPDAKIIMQATMRVSGKKNSTDAIFNNSNINARNNAIATLADNRQIFYIDVNEMVCDEEGNLAEEYTFDQIHLFGVYNDLCKQFLLCHGV